MVSFSWLWDKYLHTMLCHFWLLNTEKEGRILTKTPMESGCPAVWEGFNWSDYPISLSNSNSKSKSNSNNATSNATATNKRKGRIWREKGEEKKGKRREGRKRKERRTKGGRTWTNKPRREQAFGNPVIQKHEQKLILQSRETKKEKNERRKVGMIWSGPNFIKQWTRHERNTITQILAPLFRFGSWNLDPIEDFVGQTQSIASPFSLTSYLTPISSSSSFFFFFFLHFSLQPWTNKMIFASKKSSPWYIFSFLFFLSSN